MVELNLTSRRGIAPKWTAADGRRWCTDFRIATVLVFSCHRSSIPHLIIQPWLHPSLRPDLRADISKVTIQPHVSPACAFENVKSPGRLRNGGRVSVARWPVCLHASRQTTHQLRRCYAPYLSRARAHLHAPWQWHDVDMCVLGPERDSKEACEGFGRKRISMS